MSERLLLLVLYDAVNHICSHSATSDPRFKISTGRYCLRQLMTLIHSASLLAVAIIRRVCGLRPMLAGPSFRTTGLHCLHRSSLKEQVIQHQNTTTTQLQWLDTASRQPRQAWLQLPAARPRVPLASSYYLHHYLRPFEIPSLLLPSSPFLRLNLSGTC